MCFTGPQLSEVLLLETRREGCAAESKGLAQGRCAQIEAGAIVSAPVQHAAMDTVWARGLQGPGRGANRGSLKKDDGSLPPSRSDSGERAEPSVPILVEHNEDGELCQVNQYTVIGELGKGSFGTVRRATAEGRDDVAIKCISKRRMRREGAFAKGKKKKNSGLAGLKSELDILRRLRHPNVVELIEVIDDPSEDLVFIVLELLGKPVMDMSNRASLERIPEVKARGYFLQLLGAVEYLHNAGVVHRDIKPSNLLTCGSEDQVKLVDFGVSRAFEGDDDWLKGDSGTYAFMAPEAIDSAANLFRGRPADVWAMGVTLYCFVFAALPFYHENVPSLFTEIRERSLTFAPGVSTAVCDVLRRLLDKHADTRCSIAELREDGWVCGTAPTSPPQSITAPVTESPRSPLETMISANGPYRLTAPRGKIPDFPRAGSRERMLSRKAVTQAFYPWKLLRTTRPGDGWGAQIRRQMDRGTLPKQVKETFL